MDARVAPLLGRIAVDHPGDVDPDDGFVVTGAAQALLHPDWSGQCAGGRRSGSR
jgi:hypothetical protein